MMGPLSGKQHREYMKFAAQEQRESKKMEKEESRKDQLHEIKLQAEAAKANQQLGHKEDTHAVKLKELGGKPIVPRKNATENTDVIPAMLKPMMNPDKIPAMLSPGEAVIPASVAQDPKNKGKIKSLVGEGRIRNKSMGLPTKPMMVGVRAGFAAGTDGQDDYAASLGAEYGVSSEGYNTVPQPVQAAPNPVPRLGSAPSGRNYAPQTAVIPTDTPVVPTATAPLPTVVIPKRVAPVPQRSQPAVNNPADMADSLKAYYEQNRTPSADATRPVDPDTEVAEGGGMGKLLQTAAEKTGLEMQDAQEQFRKGEFADYAAAANQANPNGFQESLANIFAGMKSFSGFDQKDLGRLATIFVGGLLTGANKNKSLRFAAQHVLKENEQRAVEQAKMDFMEAQQKHQDSRADKVAATAHDRMMSVERYKENQNTLRATLANQAAGRKQTSDEIHNTISATKELNDQWLKVPMATRQRILKEVQPREGESHVGYTLRLSQALASQATYADPNAKKGSGDGSGAGGGANGANEFLIAVNPTTKQPDVSLPGVWAVRHKGKLTTLDGKPIDPGSYVQASAVESQENRRRANMKETREKVETQVMPTFLAMTSKGGRPDRGAAEDLSKRFALVTEQVLANHPSLDAVSSGRIIANAAKTLENNPGPGLTANSFSEGAVAKLVNSQILINSNPSTAQKFYTTRDGSTPSGEALVQYQNVINNISSQFGISQEAAARKLELEFSTKNPKVEPKAGYSPLMWWANQNAPKK